MNDWYLGPLGDLRVLPVPEPGLEITPVRYGGIHQALSGARTQDTTGIRNEYKFDFTYLEPSEYYWFESLQTGHILGPYRLLDPLKKNRFNTRTSSLIRPPGMEDILTYSREWPSAVTIPGRSYVLSGWTGSSFTLNFDNKNATATRANESITASLYMRCGTTHAGSIVMQMLDRDLNVIDTQSANVAITSSWQRFSISRTTPTGTAAVRFRLLLGSANTAVYLAAPQFETGNVATDWEPGGAAPVVIIGEMSTQSPRYPLRDISLTLLEV